ncbi:hypothetical protein FB599_1830 [Herbaspirillum sp. SJZ130]|nr:hypothetical protein [Herbaspirillum sp. SJZ102]TQK09463.1 hypothetical protein FB599_1830 [Herbaspirillum sp. SJZ130]TQK13850.1 hypothetical protein FB598_1212 [Herbaspirillum sp. SJZ106]TWC69573.1 hypothetical protein FB597_102176 [Herbaspirillum sp. SJZ099]
MPYSLPVLPYAYVNKLNAAVAGVEWERLTVEEQVGA